MPENTGQRLDNQSILVRPERSRVSEFCTKLTTLTQAEVETGTAFSEACDILKKQYKSREGVHHRAGDDAWNIARILAELLSKLQTHKTS